MYNGFGAILDALYIAEDCKQLYEVRTDAKICQRKHENFIFY